LNNTSFQNELKGKSTKAIKNHINTISKILEQYSDDTLLTDYTLEEISTLIYEAERIALNCRASCEDIEKVRGTYFDESIVPTCLANNPCSVSFDGNSLIVKSPMTLKKGGSSNPDNLKQNYTIMTYVSLALSLWKRQHPEVDMFMQEGFTNGNLVCIIKRCAVKFNPTIHADNDNLENGRIINTMCSALGVSDNCNVLDLYSKFAKVDKKDEEGTEFIITSRNNLSKYI